MGTRDRVTVQLDLERVCAHRGHTDDGRDALILDDGTTRVELVGPPDLTGSAVDSLVRELELQIGYSYP